MPKKPDMKCYFGCAVDGPLHRFPKWVYPHEEKFNSWKAILNPSTQEKDNEYIYNNVRICYRHFEKCFQLPSHQLTKNAVPTLRTTLTDNLQEQAVSITATTSPTIAQETALISTQNEAILPTAASTSFLSSESTQQAASYPAITEKVTDSVSEQRIKTSDSSLTTVTHKHKSRGFIKKIDILKKTIIKLRNKCKTQTAKIRMAEKISKKKIFLKVIEELPEPAKIFTNLQLQHTKKPRGRKYTKYTIKEKVLSLTILKQSAKGYNLLRKLFVLPSKRTLQKLLSYVVLKPGINPQIMAILKKTLANKKISEEKRLCSLIFDEVALSPGLYFNKLQKEVTGFEDFGYKKTSKIADHALVVMIKSIKGKFKQPICFTFCQSATKKEDLKIIIKDAIKAVTAAGLKVICTVCDQSSTNISTINNLLDETKAEYLRKGEECRSLAFIVEGIKIFPVFDPPHLLKGIRNNFLTKNIRYTQDGIIKIAKWEHIIMFTEKDVEDDELKLVKKLTDLHTIKEKIPKMKVKYAAQIFSQKLSGAIKFCTRHDVLPKECNDTADLLFLIDQLFDSFNGSSYTEQDKKFRGCLKMNSPHFQLWEKALPILRSMGFETKKRDSSIKYEKVPSINNFIHNINVYKEMWAYLHKEFNITSLLPRNINQDPLENFFCKVRSNGVRNTNPTCDQFVNAYKTLLINNFSTPHSVNANCEDDGNGLWQSLESLLAKEPCASQTKNEDIEFNYNVLMEELETTEPAEGTLEFTQLETKKYVAGAVLKKARAKIFKNCPVCTKSLLSTERVEKSYIYERDYTKKSLTYPSNDFFTLIKDIFHIIVRCIQETPESRNLLDLIIFNIDIYCDFNKIITCEAHASLLKKFVSSYAINVILHSWCGGVTKILKGKITKFNRNDKIKQQAFNYYKTHSKYKK